MALPYQKEQTMNHQDRLATNRKYKQATIQALVHLSEGKVIPTGPMSSKISWSKVGMRALAERTGLTLEQTLNSCQALKEQKKLRILGTAVKLT
jgi:hypothetical protein